MRRQWASILKKAKTCAVSAILLLAVSVGVSSYARTSAGLIQSNTNQARETSIQPPDNLRINPPGPASAPIDSDYLSSKEYRLAILISAVCFVTLVMLFFLLRGVPKLRAEDSLRTFGVALIIMGTLFFVTAGFSAEQIAPAIGLFGTIAGYLLGRIERKTEDQRNA
jgi:hypothetical protein